MAAAKRKEPSSSETDTKTQAGTVRLLLHTVDGAIPYLTPYLLEKCFPIEQVQDYFWLGIAVRDACIKPILDGKRRHPSGYMFSSNASLDPWLDGYHRVTVPTLDPVQDAIQFSSKKVADDSTLTSGPQHVMVWTDNGRQKLTHDSYWEAAKALNSHASVSLFDVCASTTPRNRRRRTIERTNQWREEMLERKEEIIEDPQQLWAACLLVPPGEDGREDPLTEQQFTSLQEYLSNETIGGVAFMGPSTGSDQLASGVKRLSLKPSSTASIAILATQNFSHFLDCYQAGINILGTNLPSQWAKSKKVFLCTWDDWKQEEPNRLKRPKLDASTERLDSDGCYPIGKGWIQDTGPILEGCACMACQKNNRAYLFHLVDTKELLVELLIFIHNLHHLLELCKELSVARQEGKETMLVDYIKKQMN